MSATIKKINAALQRAGFKGEIVRGEGYHYFVGDDFDYAYSTSIPIMYTKDLTVEGSLAEAEKFRAESNEREAIIKPLGEDVDTVFYHH